MTQNLLFTMIRLFVKPKSKRDLLRIQRRYKVLSVEKMADKSQSSSDEEKEDLTVDADSDIKILNQLIKSLQSQDYKINAALNKDLQMQELIFGVMYKDRQEKSENIDEDEKKAQKMTRTQQTAPAPPTGYRKLTRS